MTNCIYFDMKLVYISQSAIPSTRANSIQVMNMCSSFVEQGIKVTLLSYRGDSMVDDVYEYYGVRNKFPIVYYSHSSNGFVRYFDLLRRLYLIRTKIDVIYTRDFYAVLLVNLLSNYRSMLEMHSPVRKSLLSLLCIKYLYFSRKLKGIVVISNKLKELFEERFGRDDKLFVLHDGARLNRMFDINKKSKVQVLNGVYRVGYAGSLYPGRGFELIIELAKEFSDFEFCILGEINEELIRLNVPKNIKFQGWLNPSEVVDILRTMNVLVAPYGTRVSISGDPNSDSSLWMSPLKLFDYMSSGVPFITTDHDVFQEFLLDDFNCKMYKKDNYSSLRSVLSELTNDMNERNRIAYNAYQSHKLLYNWDMRCKKILSLL